MPISNNFELIPSDRIVYSSVFLLNGASSDMNVNGSVTPVNFSFTAPAGQVWYLENLSLFISDTGNPAENEFGDIAALTNGLLGLVNISAVEYNIFNLIDNIGLVTNFCDSPYSPFATNGYFNNNDIYFGTMNFKNPITLNSADSVTVRVRDNLTAIGFLRIHARLWRSL